MKKVGGVRFDEGRYVTHMSKSSTAWRIECCRGALFMTSWKERQKKEQVASEDARRAFMSGNDTYASYNLKEYICIRLG
jgi:hypothetical protein